MQDTQSVLKQFTDKSLYDACCDLLHYFKISFNEVTADPIPFEQFYSGAMHSPMPKGLKEIVDKIADTYYIGQIDSDSLVGKGSAKSSEELEALSRSGKYDGMMVFAVDVPQSERVTRSEMAMLTRGFNRTVAAQPVILIIRQGSTLALATCERMEYTQQWRDGEKLGKVSILRDINCNKLHRGHIDILEELGKEKYSTFDDLYKHWMEVFSSKLLTERFYGELSNWYAWAIQQVRFPNDLSTTDVNKPMNDMAVIRMITRLIFVWFLYCKRLIPKEFFDKEYIHNYLLENFAPEGNEPLLYNPDDSKYYRTILQNLFFAMLNRPIVAEGKGIANNRRFRSPLTPGANRNWDYNVNNLLRYEKDFKAGGAELFLQLANSRVPFLNGGLFDCLDDKPHKMYYDGFSERKESLERLHVPDYIFFGGTANADLSTWYNDKKKKHVRVEGLIDIFHRYYFTIEENTPLDQDVSLDPELLGKVFENLLAAYVPETGSNARKQTGSFYTPREVVQNMVVESLVAHLKRMCGAENESIYRALLSYSDEEVVLPDELRRSIMLALYNCRILDPACGSGAFPMGMLQMMVHVLRRIDPDNTMWHKLMVEQATVQAKKAFETKDDEERKERLADIENAFNRSVNDPDYARKLYLIEHCIYGVDIQPIAIQISKLRFFISLIVDQRPTTDAANNFGIRPLPNLEANFVAANTLIPVSYDHTIVDQIPEVVHYKEKLKELNHEVFLAGRNYKKEQLKAQIKETRKALAKAIEDSGFVQPGIANQLASWDMFDQNTSSAFFDPEWMFGVKGGFDVVIANPPYVRRTKISNEDKKLYEKIYVSTTGQYDLYLLFIEFGLKALCHGGYLCYINPIRFFNSDYGYGCRKFIISSHNIISILDISQLDVFENVLTYPCIMLIENKKDKDNTILYLQPHSLESVMSLNWKNASLFKQKNFESGKCIFVVAGDTKISEIIQKIDSQSTPLSQYFDVARGLANNKVDFNGSKYNAIKSKSVDKYIINGEAINIDTNSADVFKYEMIILPRTVLYLKSTLKPKDLVLLDRIYYLIPKIGKSIELQYVIGIINSKLINFWFEFYYNTTKVSGNYFDLNGNQILSIPIPSNDKYKEEITNLVSSILNNKRHDLDTSVEESRIDLLVYHLYGLTYDEVLVVDPQTTITRKEYEET